MENSSQSDFNPYGTEQGFVIRHEAERSHDREYQTEVHAVHEPNLAHPENRSQLNDSVDSNLLPHTLCFQKPAEYVESDLQSQISHSFSDESKESPWQPQDQNDMYEYSQKEQSTSDESEESPWQNEAPEKEQEHDVQKKRHFSDESADSPWQQEDP